MASGSTTTPEFVANRCANLARSRGCTRMYREASTISSEGLRHIGTFQPQLQLRMGLHPLDGDGLLLERRHVELARRLILREEQYACLRGLSFVFMCGHRGVSAIHVTINHVSYCPRDNH